MPVDYRDYPVNWHEIRRRILERARDPDWDHRLPRCECIGECGEWHDEKTKPGPIPSSENRCTNHDGRTAYVMMRPDAMVVLTLAHLCQDKSCDDESHIRAMCQACHLWTDAPHRQAQRAGLERERSLLAGQMEMPLDR